MLNLAHFNAPLPKDSATKQFLVSDYFHDSYITEVGFDPELNSLIVLLAAEREGAHYKNRNNPEYQYKITFEQCVHIDSAISELPVEYLNGRFKYSAKVLTANHTFRKQHFHFRMQVAQRLVHCTYINVVFRRARVQRVRGRTVVPAAFRHHEPFLGYPRHWARKSDSEVLSKMHGRDAATRPWALELMARRNHPAVLPQAIKWMRHREPEHAVTAARVIGLLGSKMHVPLLMQALGNQYQPSGQREILDAIELIAWREANRRPKVKGVPVHIKVMRDAQKRT